MRYLLAQLESYYYPCGYSSNVGMLYCFPGLARTLLNYGGIRQIVSIAKLMMTTKRNNFSLPYAMDMASTFSLYYLDCTTHTTQPIALVAYEIVFQSVLYMTNLAYLPWSSRHWVETETISNSNSL